MIEVRKVSAEDVAGICDHTFLNRPECYRGKDLDPVTAYAGDLHSFIQETLTLATQPYAVCIRAEETSRVRKWLEAANRESIKIVACVGFPLGDLIPTAAKVYETYNALDQGAAEVDMVLCWEALREAQHPVVHSDVAAVVKAAHANKALVKVVLEVCQLTETQIREACRICAEEGADFVKTSTGFSKSGATIGALQAMRKNFSGGIKLAGGVNHKNVGELLVAAIGDMVPQLDPLKVRIGESSLLLPLSPA